MGYGISADINIFINHTRKDGIDGQIASSTDLIHSLEKELCVMVGMNPRDLVSPDDISDGSVAEVVKNKIDSLLDLYREEVITLYKLELLKDNINEVTEG